MANEILPFGLGAESNVMTQAEYEAMSARAGGFSSGVAKSEQLNKVWRQSSFVASVLADFIANQSGNDVLDNGNTQQLLDSLELAIKKYSSDNLPSASLSQKGIVQLSSATNSDSETLAATSKAVKTANDAALKIVNNLSEIAAAGPNAVLAAITNLNLLTTVNDANGALQVTRNLSDVADKATARTNLGMGTAAIQNVGSAINNVPSITIADNRYLKQSGGTVVGDAAPIVIRAASANAALYLLAQQSNGSGAWYLGMPVAGSNRLIMRSYANNCEMSLSSQRADVTVPLYIEGGKAYYPGNKPPLTNVWVSDEYTPMQNTPTIVSHGIAGIDPLLCKADVLLKCVTANNGYSAGDFAVNFTIHSATNTAAAPLPLLTATQVQLNTGAEGTGLLVTNRSNGNIFLPTLSNWRYIFRIFY
ncbi:tail fiber protein [Yersinia similis]|uniref:tail fiber protein n=1 Tax=Yersinia similis TaxID=367190 RepID=UPI00384D17A5